MSPVPNPVDHPGVDTGEGYGVTTKLCRTARTRSRATRRAPGGSMALVRNDAWDQASDPVRPAYPDKWVVSFGVDPKLLDQRLMSPSGDDEFAMQYGQVQPENLPTIFADPRHPNAEFAGRAISELRPVLALLLGRRQPCPEREDPPGHVRGPRPRGSPDRARRRLLRGPGHAASSSRTSARTSQTPACTPICTVSRSRRPAIPILPSNSSPTPAREAPTLKWNYSDTAVGQQYFAVVQESLQEAGFTVEPGPIPPADYYNTVFDPENELRGQFGNAGWGPDWPNASTVIAPLFTQVGGWDLSQVDDDAFNAAVQDALVTLDRAEQATKWQALDKEAISHAWVIPTFFGRSQTIAGTKVGATSSADLTADRTSTDGLLTARGRTASCTPSSRSRGATPNVTSQCSRSRGVRLRRSPRSRSSSGTRSGKCSVTSYAVSS